MGFWELVLFVLVCLVGGSVICVLLFWIVSLFVREPQTTILDALSLLFISEKPEVPSLIKEQPKLIDIKFITEVENNLSMVSERWTGELIHFDTSAWDAQQYDIYDLPSFLRNDLEEVYDLMSLANNITWISTEFNRRTKDMDETYSRIYTSIATRLRRVKQYVK